jgi:V8-like Glu-specific endopeptidase
MKKNLITKLSITLLISIAFSILIVNYNVEATNSEQTNITLNEILNTEEKIMKYDAITNKTTEVDVEELKEIVTLQSNKNAEDNYSLTSYNPSLNSEVYSSKIPLVSLSSATTAERITNTSGFPYKVTCRVTSNDNNGGTHYGTASIVGPNAAITAAHCVFDSSNGNAVLRNWTLYPGYNGGTYYGTATGWSQVYYSSTWMNNHSYEYDWAICVLQSDVGNQIGWYGVQSYGTNSEMNNLPVRVLGYPADPNYGFDSRYQYQTGEKITSVYNNYFRYSAWTFGGFSGGPIIRSDNYIVGVHYGVSGIGDQPTGVRITQNMIDIIRSLR